MSNIQITVEEINKMNPLDIALSAPVRQRFIQIYDTLWGEGTGESAYERESIFFNRILADNAKTVHTESDRRTTSPATTCLAVAPLTTSSTASSTTRKPLPTASWLRMTIYLRTASTSRNWHQPY